jgi:predicted Zn-dependent peptidase
MDPADLADDALDRALFESGHPFHRPLAGTAASVASLDADAVRAFAAARYAPRGGGMVVVGDLRPEEVLDAVDRRFRDWEGEGRGPDETAPDPASPEPRVVVVRRPGSVQSEIRIGHVGPSKGDPDEVPLRVLNIVLGGAFTSRLNLSLRERHGFTYGVRSHFSFRRSGGLFTIGAAVQTEVTAAALAEAMAVFRGFATEGPTAEELDRARDYLAGVFPLRMETTAQLASRLAELLLFRLPDDTHHLFRERIRSVTPDDALAAARAHLHPERAAIVVTGDADRVAAELEPLGLGAVQVVDP